MKSSPSSAAASQPDVEDLIKYKASDATKANANVFTMQHDTSWHSFRPQELLATRTKLLAWYDVHRRKLPWRGDLPPYLTTSTHTSQKKEQQAAATNNKIDEYMLKEEVVGVNCEETEEQAEKQMRADSAVEPRKLSPYETWVSEIMLQQTRVDTVIDYFLRWINKFPTIAALAVANEEDVNALWAGLGYYRRARMLHAGAKYVMENYDGELPSTVEELLTIPGVGPYTAGAIASIAFKKREPLVDGNVIRVMARMRAVGADPKNKRLITFSWKAAKELVSECVRPGAFNQALMELGATMCTVQNPQCLDCPVQSECLAYKKANSVKRKNDTSSIDYFPASLPSCSICDCTRTTEWDKSHTEVTQYPLKAKKNASKNEVIAVAVVSSHCEKNLVRRKRKVLASTEATSSPSDWRYLMSKRSEGGLLAGQWEFLHNKVSDGNKVPSYSKRKALMDARLTKLFGTSALTRTGESIPKRRDLGELTHVFSHVKHYMGIEHVHYHSEPELLAAAESPDPDLRWMTVAEMKQLGITTGVKKILELVLHPTSKPKSKVKAPTHAVSHVTKNGSKRLKTIAAFFERST